MRAIVDNPTRWQKFLEAIDAQLANKNPEAFLKAFEHGYGRAPQALDVNLGGVGGGPATFVVRLDDGTEIGADATGLPAADPTQHGAG